MPRQVVRSPSLEGFKQRLSGMDAVNGVATFGPEAGPGDAGRVADHCCCERLRGLDACGGRDLLTPRMSPRRLPLASQGRGDWELAPGTGKETAWKFTSPHVKCPWLVPGPLLSVGRDSQQC